MVRHVPVTLVVGVLAAACNPSMRLEVLEPSLVTSPPEIRTLAVVDRSRAKNFGQGVLGAIEGALTGEAIGADNEGRSRAMTAVVVGLRNSPRFDAAETFMPRKELESSLFDKELSWKTASRICRETGCQGIVALEAFDSDSRTDARSEVKKETDDNGREVSRTEWQAERETRVTTAWRYYDVVNRRVIDDVRTFDRSYTWTETGNTKGEAISRLPEQTYSVAYVGELAGASYARRIAPTYVWVTRSYYGTGHDQLKLAKNHVKALDWAGAADIWNTLYEKDADPKIRGKAAYNLALASEVDGDLRNASSWATEAAVLLANGKARSYRRLIEQRLADQIRLEEQMEMSAPGTVAPERPLAVPREKPASPRRVGGEDDGPSTPSGGNRSSTGN